MTSTSAVIDRANIYICTPSSFRRVISSVRTERALVYSIDQGRASFMQTGKLHSSGPEKVFKATTGKNQWKSNAMSFLRSLLRWPNVAVERVKIQAVSNFLDVAVTKADKFQTKLT